MNIKSFLAGISSGKIPIKLAVPFQLRFINVGCGDNHIIGMTSNKLGVILRFNIGIANQRIYGWGDFGQGRLVGKNF